MHACEAGGYILAELIILYLHSVEQAVRVCTCIIEQIYQIEPKLLVLRAYMSACMHTHLTACCTRIVRQQNKTAGQATELAGCSSSVACLDRSVLLDPDTVAACSNNNLCLLVSCKPMGRSSKRCASQVSKKS